MFSRHPDARSARKARLREAQKNWLKEVSERRGQSLTAMAREIGIDQSALTRFMNDDERGSTLDTMTIAGLVEITGEPPPLGIFGEAKSAARPGALREAEAIAYQADTQRPTDRAIAAYTGLMPNIAAWQMKSRALEGDGVLPGDILIVDLNLEPRSGDIVCAQIYDWQKHSATQTVFRLYEAPYLISSGPAEGGRKPRIVDGDNTVIKGVVCASFRPRRD